MSQFTNLEIAVSIDKFHFSTGNKETTIFLHIGKNCTKITPNILEGLLNSASNKYRLTKIYDAGSMGILKSSRIYTFK